jgi:radical SAM superfamily enzyme YgiQ (UPF0313 family)
MISPVNTTTKKLILINPVNTIRKGFLMRNLSTFPPLALAIIASLTPADWEVKILDENIKPFEFEDADLVGLTSFTASANRAYEIAGIYRQKGIKTIMGGIHASMLPDEALLFVDSVVIGEAESVWKNVIGDFETGALKTRYTGELLPMGGHPLPRHELFSNEYSFSAVQTSRGCPMKCDFCSVSTFNGCQYRQRPIEEILDELEMIPKKLLFFFDDNIIGYGKPAQERAIELFKGMVRRKIKKHWVSQASLNFADNPEVLKWAAKAGCKMIFIGLEAETEDQLNETGKKLNLRMGVDAYSKVIRKIHRHGISVNAGFIFGMDHDTTDSINRRFDYMLRSSIDSFQTTILTPLPGTALFERFVKEKRLLFTDFPTDWKYYDYAEPVIQPKNMTPDELYSTMKKNFIRLYNRNSVRKRLRRSLFNIRRFEPAWWGYVTNYNYYCMAFEKEIRAGDPVYSHWLLSEKAAQRKET